jgi:thiamine kinase-like enzyme
MFTIRIARLDGKPGFHTNLIELLSDIISMNEIDDNQIADHLAKYNIPHLAPPYVRIRNNNYAVTDDINFFLKFGNEISLQIELDTVNHLSTAPEAYIKEITFIGSTPIIVTKYIHHDKLTASNLNSNHLTSVFNQLKRIQGLPISLYKETRKLDAVYGLLKNRLSNPTLAKERKESLEFLINSFIVPYVDKYSKVETLAHTDVKMDNILRINERSAMLIDYESIKPSPAEMDVASLFQDLYQTGSPITYKMFEDAYRETIGTIRNDVLKDSILFKNTLSTTATVILPTPEVLDSRIAILMEAARTKEVPKRLARVDLSKAL